jgi:hypothetical protein
LSDPSCGRRLDQFVESVTLFPFRDFEVPEEIPVVMFHIISRFIAA